MHQALTKFVKRNEPALNSVCYFLFILLNFMFIIIFGFHSVFIKVNMLLFLDRYTLFMWRRCRMQMSTKSHRINISVAQIIHSGSPYNSMLHLVLGPHINYIARCCILRVVGHSSCFLRCNSVCN